MDPRLLTFYEQELRYFRESSVEFAKQFPKIAGRLGVESTEIADPYVERLIEATAFLSARVGLKLSAEYPHFTQNLLEIVYPNYLAPTPAMMVVQLTPDLLDPNLAQGVTIARGSAIRALQAAGQSTYCEFSTAQTLNIFPIEITKADYFRYAPDLPLAQHPRSRDIQGGVRIKLSLAGEIKFSQITLNELMLHLGGQDDVAWQLHECFLGDAVSVMLRPLDASGNLAGSMVELPSSVIKPVGFDDDEALLPNSTAGFSGYRIAHEYFAFSQRFQFVKLTGLQNAVRSLDCAQLELIVLFSRGDAALEKLVTRDNFLLNCVPVVNLFSKRLDRVNISDSSPEFHLLPDRTRPQDFEIFSISEVTGYGKPAGSNSDADAGTSGEQTFKPFYAAFHGNRHAHPAYYTLRREPRLLSTRQKTQGNRTSYIGSEVFLQLVDPQEAPYSNQLRQLGAVALCTNRDLPVLLSLSRTSDFELSDGILAVAIKVVRGPSRPSLPMFGLNSNWHLIDHLSMNYLSVADANPLQAAAHLRETLLLYAKVSDDTRMAEINGLKSVHSKAITRRLPMKGPIAFGRGLEVTLEVDELAFHGGSAFLFGAMLSQLLRRQASANSFIETSLRSHNKSKNERMRWRAMVGDRAVL
jgi:type VI secretion system protein ImpG